MLTKTQIRILQMFVSSITRSFSSIQASKELGIDYKNVHVAMKSLAVGNFLNVDHNLYSLNYKKDHQELAYVEHLRSKAFLKKNKNGMVKLFVEDALKKIEEDSFVFLIFGSTVNEPKPRDTDVLMIVDSQEKVEPAELLLYNVGDLTPLKLDVQVISHESVYEMLEKRDQNNLINMVLNRHLIVYGAETFYRMLAKGRK